VSDHPVLLTVSDDLRRSRLTVFFRLLLAIPHYFWIWLWSIAAVFAVIAAWFAGLLIGRVPTPLHNFLAAYVRYATHLVSYLSLVANPYPSFTGTPGYPLDVDLPESKPQRRWTIALRLLLAIPASLVAAVLGAGLHSAGAAERSPDSTGDPTFFYSLGGALAAIAVLGWFAALVIGRMPRGLRNLGAYGIGYGAQTWAYFLLLTERYPDSDPDAIGPGWELPQHQVQVAMDDDGRRSRLTVFFRLLLAIPHFVWLTLWTIAAFLAALANGVVALIRGRSAEALHRFLAAYVRYAAHVTAFATLVANPFPGFTGDPGYPVDIAIGPPERQSRWITLFRSFLVVPALIVSSVLTGVLVIVGLLGWFAALVTGRMPDGLRNLGAYAIRYLSQTNAYWFIVTDDYPHASPALRPPPEPEPEYEYVPPRLEPEAI
jgi:Domain of unknown function (DUF4389)